MRIPHRIGLLLVLALIAGAAPVSASTLEIGPEDDFCTAANALPPGGELVLRPGDYRGPCTILKGGAPGAPIVIRAADLQQRPHLVYTGRTANVLDIKADHVTIRGLSFGPTSRDADGIRVFSKADVVVEDSVFTEVGGIAVAATHYSIRGLVVRRNRIERSGSTGMYFGCHEGVQCVVSGLVVERNYIHTIRAVDPEIGYGLQVKLNSSGVIRDNVIIDTKGPGIMVYGSRDLISRSIIERNFVMGAQTSAGIVVGGGPVIVRNNISIQNRGAGIGLEDYHGRGLLRAVVIGHNTLYRNAEGGVSLSPEARARDVAIVNNAVHTRQGAPTVPRARPEIELAGNVDCTWALCFANPELLDFSAVDGSLLRGPGSMRGPEWVPSDDYFGMRRTLPPVRGAIQAGAGPIDLGPKP
jgi:hypothetical protein